MSARARIEWITNNWYAFLALSAGLSVLTSGFGLLSLIFTAFGFAIGCGITWVLGKKLLAGSGMTRFFLVVISALGIVFTALGLMSSLWFALVGFSLKSLLNAVMCTGMIMLFGRSYRSLTDKAVKAHCA